MKNSLSGTLRCEAKPGGHCNLNEEIIYRARASEDTSCPAVPAAYCPVYHKYFIELNVVLRKDCVVGRFKSPSCKR